MTWLYKHYYYNRGIVSLKKLLRETYGCGIGIVGGRIGEWGIEGEDGANRIVRNGSRDGLGSKCYFQICSMSVSIHG